MASSGALPATPVPAGQPAAEDLTAPQRPGPPITELARDLIVAALDYLGAADLAAVGTASRLLMLLAGEVQRRPTLVVEVGSPGDVLAAMRQRLVATPTMGFLFGTGDFEEEDGALARLLARQLPAGCHLIGATTDELQAVVPAAAGAADVPEEVARKAALRHVEDVGQVTLLLGSFPDATTQSFFIPFQQCMEVANTPSDAAALEALLRLGLPASEGWKTVVLLVCGTGAVDPERIIKAFQLGSPNAAIIGGIAGHQLMRHAYGKTRVESAGIAGLALKGNVPLTALVSRGCVPASRPYRIRGARLVPAEEGESESQDLVIPELIGEDQVTMHPLDAVLQAQRQRRVPLLLGIRTAPGGGYLLEHLSQGSFERGGALRVPATGELQEGPPADCELRFFQLDPDECRSDLRRLLSYVKQQCEEGNEQILGTVMFTCGGRGRRFFQEDFVDMKQFQALFPQLPLVGFWAGGEIGPQALAEAAPAEATRTGRASLQGFTAVFGIFRAPLPTSRTAYVGLPDEAVPAEVGRVFARLSREAKERGNAAFKEKDLAGAVAQYVQAIRLAAVQSAEVPPAEQATILANLSIARLKAGEPSEALADAEAASALDGRNGKAHYRRAQALLQLGRAPEAAAVLRAALQQLPDEAALAELLSRAEAVANQGETRPTMSQPDR